MWNKSSLDVANATAVKKINAVDLYNNFAGYGCSKTKYVNKGLK